MLFIIQITCIFFNDTYAVGELEETNEDVFIFDCVIIFIGVLLYTFNF